MKPRQNSSSCNSEYRLHASFIVQELQRRADRPTYTYTYDTAVMCIYLQDYFLKKRPADKNSPLG